MERNYYASTFRQVQRARGGRSESMTWRHSAPVYEPLLLQYYTHGFVQIYTIFYKY
jgi:hypothetical protein